MAKRGVLCRNGNTWTESQYFGAIRSALRGKFRWWVPMTKVLNKARRKYVGRNKRIKWEYQCAECKEWNIRDKVHMEHKIPCGSLTSYDDIVPFVQRLTTENEDDFQVLCKVCHQKKSTAERKERKCKRST